MSKKNTERLSRYQHELELSRKWREEEGYDDLWDRLLDLYTGKHFPYDLGREDQISVNVAFATINVIYPAVSINHPKITVLANEPENEDRALFCEAILNYWWKHFDFHTPFRLAVKDFLLYGHGWIKCGWLATTEEVPLTDEELRDEYFRQLDEAQQFALDNPEMAYQVPTAEQIAENLVQTKTVAREDRPFMERVDPRDIVVDTDATGLHDARWVAQRIVRLADEVRKDKRYKASARANVKGTLTLDVTLDRHDKKKYGSEIERVAIWEFYDLVEGTLCVFADGSDEYLVDPIEMPYAFGHPFVMLRNYDVPGCFYPIGDLEMLEPLQLEINKTRSALMNARKAFGRKYLARTSALDQKAQAALQDDRDNVVVPIEDDRPFAEVIMPMPHAQLDPQLYSWSDIIENDVQMVSGVSEYQRGTAPDVRRTATEAAMIQDATNARSADKLSIVERFITDIARKVLQLGQQFLTGEHVARVVGRYGQVIWLPYTQDDIIGEYDFTVEAGSTKPQNDQSRRQDALTFVQAVAPFMQTGIVDPIAVAKHVLQEGFRIRNVEKFIRPDALEMLEMQKAQQAQQLAAGEQQLMQGEAAMQGGMPPEGGPAGAPEAQGPLGVGAPNMAPADLLGAQQQAMPAGMAA